MEGGKLCNYNLKKLKIMYLKGKNLAQSTKEIHHGDDSAL